MTEEIKRNSTFDIIKGIAIILMVLGHTSHIFGQYVGLFHMGIFFICSGYFFKDKCYESIESVKKFIKNKIIHLYLPFIIFNGILTLLHNFFLKINIYTTNPDFLNLEGSHWGLAYYYTFSVMLKKLLYTLLFLQNEQMGGGTWFVRVLFWILIINCIFHFIIKKIIKNEKNFKSIRLLLFIFTFLLGYLCQKLNYNFYSIGTTLSCSFLYFIGITYKDYKDKLSINKYTLIISTIVFIIVLYYFAGFNNFVDNKYKNIFTYLIANITGFYWVHNISFYINKINKINKIFEYIGQHTLSILFFHFLAFKIITYIQVIIYDKPDYYLASFTTLITSEWWWILYVLAGTLIPLLLAFIYSKIKQSKLITSLSFLKLP
ncbi:acyltransferase family protein [bacterium]|nr:acyltransferase family protein [bacterium]